ncbi:hypothetical protein [Rugosimonospora africana]|uniref:Uncharacterized protein n=1 Tax=Rugosimonospora africana TaxID=556532 RepID=A0A8J3QTC8_9ACTN|nr:hypothetical protein [Rugosimonospora africana]GIH16124.1 hypothetical protein Raf01_42960 [Rugosimonospora africana]
MTSDNPLPPTLATWVYQQARASHRYLTGPALWEAVDAAHPGLLPSDPRRLSRDWPVHRELMSAYVAGLPEIEVGDPVIVTLHGSDQPLRATLTAVHDTLLVRVALDGDDGPGLDVARIAVDPVPVVYYTATIITFDGSDTNAYGEGCEAGRGYREESGWWDPTHHYWKVHPQRSAVTPEVCPDGADPASWLADRLATRLGSLDGYDGRTFTGAREAIYPGRLTGAPAQQPGAVLGTNTLLGDALAAGRLRRPKVGQRTLTAAGHAHGFRDEDLLAAARHIGLITAPPASLDPKPAQDVPDAR